MAAIGGVGTGRTPISRGQILALIAVLAGGGLLGWVGFRTAFGEGTTTTAPVATVPVVPRTITQTATTSGNVVSQRSSKLTFAVAGRLASISVLNGQSVQAGDVIASLDVTQLQYALDQAKSNETSAQAKLDALLAGQTPDVVEAARADVANSQAAETSAEGQVSSAQTAKTTANDSAATARNSISTAQDQVQTAVNGVSTAHDQVINAQNSVTQAQNSVAEAQNSVTQAQSQVTQAENQVTQAQNAYTALLAGPTAQDIAVSQAAVDSARVSLDTARANYNRLVNHTDIATRPETTSLIQASSAYQSALANLANAQPQAPNPIDVASQQLAVQTAQQQVGFAQNTSSNAQLTLQQALQTLGLVQQIPNTGPQATPVYGGGAAGCVVLQGSFCVPNSAPIQPTAADQLNAQINNPLNQAEAAVTSAQNQANSAAAAVVSANQAYQQALNNLQKLINPTTNQNLIGLQTSVDSSRQQLDVARRNFDAYMSLSDLAIRPEKTALDQAQSGYQTALAQYNLKVQPARDTDISNAQSAISNAQAQLETARAAFATTQTQVDSARTQVGTTQAQVDSAQAAERNANVSVSSAQTGVSNAQDAADSAAATAANADSAIKTAMGQVNSAKETIVSAQKKLDVITGPPLPTDVAQLTEAVKQAHIAVQNAQSNVDGALIRAPFTGIITAVNANPGDQVTSGTTIVQLVDPTHFEIDAQVDETTYGQIKLGMPVTVRMDALPTQNLVGVISNIIPNGVTQQGVVTFPIVVTLTTPGVVPPSGATAGQILITLQAKQNVLGVPPRYLYRDANGQQVVDVIVNGKRIPTPVTTGLATDTYTEITSGLKANDQIALPVKKGSGSSGTAFGQGGVPGIGGAAGR